MYRNIIQKWFRDFLPHYIMTINDDRYTICDNCDVKIDCEEQHIFCIYKGEQSNPDEEMTICELCNHDLKLEFQSDGFHCDDWELEENTS